MVRVVLATLLLVSSLIAAPGAAASEEECASPPCGWIAPLLDMIFEDKPPCGAGYLSTEVNPADCMAPPAVDEPIVMEGTFRLYWELCEEATYTSDPQDPIVVSFQGTNRNPSFIGYSVEPSEFILDSTTLLDPQYIIPEQRADGSQTCWYDYQQPITLTFTRTGEPTASDMEQINNQGGIAQFHLKLLSDESGERFKQGWGIEPFRFHMANDPTSEFGAKPTPGVAMPLTLLAVAALALARRS